MAGATKTSTIYWTEPRVVFSAVDISARDAFFLAAVSVVVVVVDVGSAPLPGFTVVPSGTEAACSHSLDRADLYLALP